MAEYSDAVLGIQDRLERLTYKIERFKARLGPMEQERAKLLTALEVLTGMQGESSGAAPAEARKAQGKETTKDAILRILRQSHKPLSIGEISRGLEREGLDVPAKTVRGTLSHGKREGSCRQVSRGQWEAASGPSYATIIAGSDADEMVGLAAESPGVLLIPSHAEGVLQG